MKITAPYNFVPLNEKVFYPSWSEQVTQDLPFSDSEDGVIEVKIKNVSPLFTRDGALNEHSAHIMGNDGKRHYFIPGTTIKGMLREIIEIMSFGKMQEDKDFQNRLFGYRDVANIMGDEIHKQYMKTVEKAKPGWLSKKGEKYFFTPCDGQLKEISRTKVKSEFPGYNPNGSIWETNVSVGSDSNQYPIYPEKEIGDKKYHIVCTGLIEKKTKELLFPSDRGKSSPLNEETIRLFKIVYEETPDFAEEKDGKGCFLMALEKGYEIPVFHVEMANGQEIIGMSKMFKLPYKNNVRQQVEFLQKADKNRHDLGETLFGYTGDNNLKGRVQISHAFMEGTVEDSELIETKGILGSPKASYYPLYIKQSHSPYKTYDDESGIAGRKLYRIHSKGTITQLPKGDNTNTYTTIKAIPAGQTFTLRISLHNTREAEIGAILAALTFNMTPDVFFNLGMAKAFGFGKCHIDKEDITLLGFSQDLNYYMQSFEEMMSVFTYENYQQMWAQTESITQLVNILREHNEEEVTMMKVEEYGDCKNETKNPFNKLQEKGTPIHSWLTDEDKDKIRDLALKAKGERAEREARRSLSEQYTLAKSYVETKEYQKAKELYYAIMDELFKKGINTQEEIQIVADIDDLIDKQEEAKKQQAAKAAQDAIEEELKAGLGTTLDKLAGDGVSYSIKDFKVCFQKVEIWLKKSRASQLKESDSNDLFNTSMRLLQEPSKKEVKELAKPFDKSGIWKKLTGFLGEDKAKELYDSYQK